MPDFDVVIVGAGPAGLAAARFAKGSVAILDNNAGPGGQIWRGNAAHPKVDAAYHDTQVFDAPEPGVLATEHRGTRTDIRYGRLILATGARELFLPFPGWTLPHVVGAGGLQALVKSGLPISGKRVAIAGSGPLLLAVAKFLTQRGAIVPIIAEQATLPKLRRFAWHAGVTRCLEAVRSVGFSRYVPGCWPLRTTPGEVRLRTAQAEFTVSCDYLACGFGLVPNTELASLLGCKLRDGFVETDSQQRTSVPSVYAAGEITGIAGAGQAVLQGEIAAGRQSPQDHSFRDALRDAFLLRDELRAAVTPDTIVCRCENVTLGRISRASGWRDAKLQTRCGMGACQGRVCGPAVEFLCGWKPESVRPPIMPVPLRVLANSP